jgi:hypothetical protein
MKIKDNIMNNTKIKYNNIKNNGIKKIKKKFYKNYNNYLCVNVESNTLKDIKIDI